MAAHLHWRLLFRGQSPANPAQYINISSLEFRATPGVAQQATGGTASADSQYLQQAAALAFDANTATYWESDRATGDRWIQYSFASPIGVREVLIRNGPFANEGPRLFDVQYSDDGTTWTSAAAYGSESAWAAGQSRTYPVEDGSAGGRRYWRLNITRTVGNSSVRVATLSLRSAPGGPSVATGGAPDASSALNNLDLLNSAKAFDADPTTYWETGATPQWLRYRFASDVEIVEYAITANSAQAAPLQWTFEHSGDGANWTVAHEVATQPAWTAGETRTFAVPITVRRRPVVFVAT